MTRMTLVSACLGMTAVLSGCDQVSVKVTDTAAGPRVIAATDIEAGRYVVLVGGCNDCHTPQYAMTNGAQPPEAEWLKGSTEGHTGPWGTSYGKNLRLTTARMTEDQWVELLNTGASVPPMPWPSVRAMSEADKRAVYRYIRSLPGEAGPEAPAALPPVSGPPPGLPAA